MGGGYGCKNNENIGNAKMIKEMPFILRRHIPFKTTLTSCGKIYQFDYEVLINRKGHSGIFILSVRKVRYNGEIK